MYGSAARALRRGGGGVKIFRWGVSPSKKAQGTAIHVFYVRVGLFESTASTSGVPPSSRTAYNYSTWHLHGTAIERTVYAPGDL